MMESRYYYFNIKDPVRPFGVVKCQSEQEAWLQISAMYDTVSSEDTDTKLTFFIEGYSKPPKDMAYYYDFLLLNPHLTGSWIYNRFYTKLMFNVTIKDDAGEKLHIRDPHNILELSLLSIEQDFKMIDLNNISLSDLRIFSQVEGKIEFPKKCDSAIFSVNSFVNQWRINYNQIIGLKDITITEDINPPIVYSHEKELIKFLEKKQVMFQLLEASELDKL